MVQTTDTRPGYPRIPAKNWWDLRRRFRQTPPRQVDSSYLQTVLGLSEGAANNLLPSLRTAGLIDEKGEPTQRAMEWRDDEHYSKVCEDIRQDVYPSTLLDALPPPDPARNEVARWFARETKTGETNARRMAAFYVLLAEANPNSSDSSGERQTEPRPAARRREKAAQLTTRRPQNASAAPETQDRVRQPAEQGSDRPVVHIDVNIHIDSNASADQIDQIFESMSRHLYSRGQ